MSRAFEPCAGPISPFVSIRLIRFAALPSLTCNAPLSRVAEALFLSLTKILFFDILRKKLYVKFYVFKSKIMHNLKKFNFTYAISKDVSLRDISIIDLIFNEGPNARKYMKSF